MNRHVEVIPSEALKALRRHAWPGNVRELANLVERAMTLSKGRTLEIPLGELERGRHRPDHDDRAATLRAVERTHILRVLGETNWTLGGPRRSRRPARRETDDAAGVDEEARDHQAPCRVTLNNLSF